VAHFRRAARHRIEHFQCRNQLTRRVDLDLQAAAAHLVDQLRETLGTDAHAREVLRPGRDHFPIEGLLLARLLALARGWFFALVIATGQSGSRQAHASGGENVTTFHEGNSLLFVLIAHWQGHALLPDRLRFSIRVRPPA